jgi:CheY-like chemotaxis protein
MGGEQTSGCRILVIDDERDIRETLIDVLTDESYRVDTVSDGRAALNVLRDAAARPPCVIVLDLMMPEMDGAEFRALQLADPRWSEVPVILVSAHLDVDRAARALKVQAHLRKPLDLDELLAALAGCRCPPGTHVD